MVKLLTDLIMIVAVALSSLYIAFSVTFENLDSLNQAMERVIADDKDNILAFSFAYRDTGETYVVDPDTYQFITPSRFPDRLAKAKGLCRTYSVSQADTEDTTIRCVQHDYGGVWVVSSATPMDFHGKRVIVCSEIDISEVFGTVALQLTVIVATIVAIHWITSALAAPPLRTESDLAVKMGMLRLIGSFPGAAVLLVSTRSMKIVDANADATRLAGLQYPSELVGRQISDVLPKLALLLDSSTMQPCSGVASFFGSRVAVVARPVDTRYWVIRLGRNKTNDRQKDTVVVDNPDASPSVAAEL